MNFDRDFALTREVIHVDEIFIDWKQMKEHAH